MTNLYEQSFLKDLALALTWAGCRTTLDVFAEPSANVYNVFREAPEEWIKVEIPQSQVVYILCARQGVSLYNARQAAVSHRHSLPVASIATLWQYNTAIFARSQETPTDKAGGYPPGYPPEGCHLVLDDPRFRLYAVTGRARLKADILPYKEGAAGVTPARPPLPQAKLPRYNQPQASRLNRQLSDLCGELYRLDCQVAAVEERTGVNTGPLKLLSIGAAWRTSSQWVNLPVIKPPDGQACICLLSDSQDQLQQDLDRLVGTLGEPGRVNWPCHFAFWLLPLDKLPPVPEGVVCVTAEAPLELPRPR